MSDIKQSLMVEFIDERLNQYEKFFSSPLWKKSLLPFLRAHYEISIRGVLQKSTAMEGDVKTGMALAFEQVINLPKAIEFRQKLQTDPDSATPEVKLDGAITGYDPFDFSPYEPKNTYEGE